MKLDVVLDRLRAGLRAACGRPARAGATWPSSAAASRACRRRWRWPGAAPRWWCSRPASVSLPRPPGATAATSTTGSRSTTPRWPPRWAWSARAPGTTPTTPRSTRWSASCATRRIDCDFVRRGKLKLATRPAHLEALSRSAERLVADGVDTDVQILHAPRVRAEVASDRFVGGLLYKRSGQMHMGRFATAWRRRPSAAARRSTPAPACSGSSGWLRPRRARRTACTPAAARCAQRRCCWPPARRGTAATAASAGCAGASCRSAASSS